MEARSEQPSQGTSTNGSHLEARKLLARVTAAFKMADANCTTSAFSFSHYGKTRENFRIMANTSKRNLYPCISFHKLMFPFLSLYSKNKKCRKAWSSARKRATRVGKNRLFRDRSGAPRLAPPTQ